MVLNKHSDNIEYSSPADHTLEKMNKIAATQNSGLEESNKIHEISDGSDWEKVEMTSVDEVQGKLTEGSKFLEETTFDHLIDKIE